MEKCVLFSFIGSSDPVRGRHDGPMLHILRHYRPETVFCMFSSEMKRRAERDDWHNKLFSWLGSHWNYKPDVVYLDLDVERVNMIDEVAAPIVSAFEQVEREHPHDRILLNLTSGTPQMLMVASLLCLDARHPNVTGVQVVTPEQRMNSALQYTNKSNPDICAELSDNLDELPEAEKRCFEPKLYALRKEEHEAHLRELLKNIG